jgi:hypothetical protein
MSYRLLRILVALYPRRWRRRYGAELEQLIVELTSDASLSRLRLVTNLFASATLERIRGRGVRAAGTTVLVACAAGVSVVTATAAPPSPPHTSSSSGRPAPITDGSRYAVSASAPESDPAICVSRSPHPHGQSTPTERQAGRPARRSMVIRSSRAGTASGDACDRSRDIVRELDRHHGAGDRAQASG